MRYFIFIAAALLLTGTNTAQADFYIHSWDNIHSNEGVLNFRGELGYFSSNANFNANSAIEVVPNLLSYNRFQTDIRGSYGLLESLSVYGTLRWSRVGLDQGALNNSSTFGLGDQSVGANYRIWRKQRDRETPPITIDLQSQFDFPPYSTATALTNGTPFLGDGTVDWTTGAFITYPVAQTKTAFFTSILGIGYTYRNRGFSSAIPYSVTAKYEPRSGKGINVSLAALGNFSLSTDRSDPLLQGTGSAGYFFTSAVNPSIFAVRGRVGYQIDPSLGFDVGFQLTAWGRNAPSIFYMVGGVNISIDPTHPSAPQTEEDPKNPLEISPDQYGKPNRGLVYYGLEGLVLRVKDRMNLVKINKGSQDGVEVGYIFDVFNVKQDGSLGEPIARGRVTSVKLNESVIAITDYFKEVWIDEGFVIKRVLK